VDARCSRIGKCACACIFMGMPFEVMHQAVTQQQQVGSGMANSYPSAVPGGGRSGSSESDGFG
jgi:hypothetical protein